MRRFLHVSTRPAFQTSSWPALSASAPLARHAVRFYAATRPLAYGRGRSSPGAPRLSFAERVARRTPKTAEMKHTAAELRREAEDYVRVEFTDEVDALARRWLLRARTAVLRLANPAAALEQLDVEILPKVKRPLLQLATVTKVTMRQLCVIAHTPQFTTALTHALQRHDRSVEVRQSGRRIYLMIDPITRQRRDETIDAVAAHKAGFQKGMKALRRRAINYVTGLGLSDEELVRELVAALEVQCHELEASHAAEFDECTHGVHYRQLSGNRLRGAEREFEDRYTVWAQNM